MTDARILTVVINAADHDRLVEFWRRFLGVEVERQVPGFTWLAAQQEGAPTVAIQQVPDPTSGRRRLHFDIGVGDMAEAVATIQSLGGRHLEDHENEGFHWKVMADPEGNEFCIGVVD